jgi:hypothetical protein
MWMTILAAFVPQILDIVKQGAGAAVNKYVGLSVDEQIKLHASEVSKMQALAALDNPFGEPSRWVVDLRGSFRYIAAFISIFSGVAIGWATFSLELDPASRALMFSLASDLIGIPFGFIFGERMRLKG